MKSTVVSADSRCTHHRRGARFRRGSVRDADALRRCDGYFRRVAHRDRSIRKRGRRLVRLRDQELQEDQGGRAMRGPERDGRRCRPEMTAKPACMCMSCSDCPTAPRGAVTCSRAKAVSMLEAVTEETPTGLRRRKRPDLGIALIDLAAKSQAERIFEQSDLGLVVPQKFNIARGGSLHGACAVRHHLPPGKGAVDLIEAPRRQRVGDAARTGIRFALKTLRTERERPSDRPS